MPDVVESEHNGLLIPPADAAALENAISRMVSSVELRRRFGEAARQTMERYTWEKSARKLEALFFRVLNEGRIPRRA